MAEQIHRQPGDVTDSSFGGTLDEMGPEELLFHAALTPQGRDSVLEIYRLMREKFPRFKTSLGLWVLTSYQDCFELLRNPNFGRFPSDIEPPAGLARRRREGETVLTMLMANPPVHTRLRSLVAREFTPKRVEAMRSGVRELAREFLARFGNGGDLMELVAVDLPVTVISELLGVPRQKNEDLKHLVRAAANTIDIAADEQALEEGERAAETLGEYFLELATHKRVHPDDGLFSALIQVEEQGDKLSEAELIANTLLLYAAGFETTSNLIGNGTRALLQFPEQMARLRSDPSLISSAVWEMLRYDSPVQMNARSCLDEGVVALEHSWERGESALVLQGAANHDDSVYRNPEVFDVGRFVDLRKTPPPLSFGWGPHHCLGAHLARLEGEEFFSELLGRTESIELLDPSPRRRASFTLWGFESLHLRLGSAENFGKSSGGNR